LDKLLGGGPREKLIQFVTDRPGHDRRYALDSSKFRNELRGKIAFKLGDGLEQTVKWYLENETWLKRCVNGEYLKYYETMYANR
jgi:dTDP-glucose 4,6-dehydratase